MDIPAEDRLHLTDVAVRGGALRVGVWEAAAPTDATPVVAVHGITGNHRSWPFLAAALPGRTVVAPDLRGRGGSRGLPGPWGMAQHADDVAAVAAAHSDGPVDLVGHSMGAFVAIVLAHRRPELVRRLVLVDGGFPFAAAEQETTTAALQVIRQRLETRFPDPAAYIGFFRAHPAFGNNWSDTVAAYAAYDLMETADGWAPSPLLDAVLADQTDLADGPLMDALLALRDSPIPAIFLHAPRGFVDDPPGLYAAPTVEQVRAAYPRLTTRLVDANHYTVVMSEQGGAAVAEAVESG